MSLLLAPMLILLAGAGVLALIWRLGVLTPPPVAAWQKIGSHYGFVDVRPLTERLGERAPFVKQLDNAFNIPRLLALAGRNESGTAWALRNLALALAVVVGFLAVELLSVLLAGMAPLPIWDGLVFALALLGLRWLMLRVAAGHRRRGIENGLAEAMTELAILTYTAQVPIDQALEILARAQSDGYLWSLLKDENWKQLVNLDRTRAGVLGRRVAPSTALIYERIGEAYELPMFSLLAASVRRIGERGQESRSVFTNLARSVGQRKLAAMQTASERSRFLQAVPLGLMIVPLITLIGYGAWITFIKALP
ncbi:MAG: type II secretion system F family protein [Candidatus Dormibacteraeota bacterium]|uniref:Type II secretion system F family protein n=1 Tax=Candidatus Dormiibacter inghamiae TaxID=3127013 RepID=A0A934KGF6_9BACT|nr:type II secretion system F family protein [Candidatus Dormibacteraeota bacterium]MBJ7605600.1 type II secretion system F family protein [Candidatus Dormibacteraeota bacterium]